jgi:hypothetical protein
LLILFAVYAEEIFHAGAMGMGNLYMARGLGAILGPLLARRLVGETPPTMYRSLGGAFLIAAGLYVVFAGMPTLWWAAAALCLATMASNVLWVFSSTLLQIETPDAYRGRVFAADFALLTIAMALSSFVTGWGLDYAAIAPRVMAAGLGGILVLPGLYWLLATRRRRQQPVMRFSFVEAGEAIRE